MKYDVIIIGAGPGGIFSAYELVQQNPDLKIAFSNPATRWRSATVLSTVTRSRAASTVRAVPS